MLSVSNLSVQFGKRILFDEVNITFSNGNCYGVIGANGAGKSTFLNVLSGKIEPSSGSVQLEAGKRMSILEQNHNLYNQNSVIETVLMGNKVLYSIKKLVACPIVGVSYQELIILLLSPRTPGQMFLFFSLPS